MSVVWLARVRDTLTSVALDMEYLLNQTLAHPARWPHPTTLRRIAGQLLTLADDIDAAMKRGRR